MNHCERAITALQDDLAGAIPGPWPRAAVGSFEAGSARFAYPEIAGYWLTWAAGHERVRTATGAGVVAWLDATMDDQGRLPTRLGDTRPPYAGTGYLFDHAMVRHGLAQWARHRHDARALQLHDRLAGGLRAFLAHGRLRASLGAANPRWSGRPGPFLLKPLARLRASAAQHGWPVQAWIEALVARALERPHREAHAQLYAIEGLWMLGENQAADHALGALLALHGGVTGLREVPGNGPWRNDVLAQALRMALLLDWPVRQEPGWITALRTLIAEVGPDGRVAFAREPDGIGTPVEQGQPTWASLFTEQALRLWQADRIEVEELA